MTKEIIAEHISQLYQLGGGKAPPQLDVWCKQTSVTGMDKQWRNIGTFASYLTISMYSISDN